MKKTFMSIFQVGFFLLLFGNPTFASELNGKVEFDKLDNIYDIMSDSELENLRESDQQYTVQLTDEQAIERAVELTGKTVDEVKAERPDLVEPEFSVMSTSTYSWYEVRHPLGAYSGSKSHYFNLIVIVKVGRNGSFTWIDTATKPLSVGLTKYADFPSKGFSGTIDIDLKSNGFYYVINGSFYDLATTSTSISSSGKLGEWTFGLSSTSTTNYWGDFYSGLAWKKVI